MITQLAQKRYAEMALKIASHKTDLLSAALKQDTTWFDSLATDGTNHNERTGVSVNIVTPHGLRPMKTTSAPRLDDLKQLYCNFPNVWKTLVTPYVLADDEYAAAWQSAAVSSTFREDERKLSTSRGDLVRSKSEVIIANTLYARGIPYRYEQSVQFSDGSYASPDFIILCPPTRREIIWEHFGLMDNPDYANNALSKMAHYIRSGLVMGHSFIATFESQQTPFDIAAIESTLDAIHSST